MCGTAGEFMAEILGADIFRWIEIVAAIVATIFVAYVISWAIMVYVKKSSFPVETGKKVAKITRYVIYVMGSILIVAYLAFDVVGAVIGLGFLGLAVGFGLAGVVNNFAAGITVIISKSFAVGDEVKVSFFEGTIIKMSMTKTVLETKDGEIVYVPNSFFLSNPVSRKKDITPTSHKHDLE